MKKLICALLSVFLISPCVAEIHIAPDTVTSAIATHFPNRQVETLTEYNSQLRASNGNGISGTGVWNVCAAGDLNIKQAMDKGKCQAFANYLAQPKKTKFFAVCGEDKGKSGGVERCVDNVFYHNYTISDTQVTMLQASGLAHEYAHIKYGDDIKCSDEARSSGLGMNYFVQCKSKSGSTYYEFKFDDVAESIDVNINKSVAKALCEMHGVKYTEIQKSYYPLSSCETSDAVLCAKIDESMKKFGYNTEIQNEKCIVSFNSITSDMELRTAFGINNMVFRYGYQMSGSATMREKLCEYIKANANTQIVSCECNYNRTQLTQGGGSSVDDVLTCYANDQPIDFVFDDLSEKNKELRKGGVESFNCALLGGEYQGKTCYTPDKVLCDKIAEATLSECPECKRAYFDETQKACVLPNATKAVEHQKNVNTGLIIGGIAVGATIVFFSGGTGAVYVALAVESVGGVAEFVAQKHIDGVADEFFIKANNCNDANCAESILKEFFQYLSHMTGDLKDGELVGIDTQMARLIELLPDDSQFLTDIVGACYEKDNAGNDNFDIAACDDGKWNSDQIIRAIGIALQFTSVFASVGKWVLGAGRVQKIAKQTPKLTKALQKEIPGAREQLAKKIAQGKIVKTSNGKEITVPKGRLAAIVANTDGKNTEITGKTKYAVINALDDWMEKNDSAVKVQYDKNMKAIYTAGIRDDAMPGIEQWLQTNRVPYSKNGNYIQIMETDLERTGAFAISADDPIITQLIKEFGDDAVNRALDNATSEEAMERAVSKIMKKREKVNIIFKDAIDTKALETYASKVKQRYLQIIANDNELTTYALRFDELDTAQKEVFANKILRKYNSGVCDGGVCRVDPELVELGGTQKHGIIQISEPHNSSLDDFMNTLAHENNHFHDESASGFLNYEQSRLGSAMAGDFTDDIDIYNTNLTEHASFEIGKIVGQGFTSELNKMIKTLR